MVKANVVYQLYFVLAALRADMYRVLLVKNLGLGGLFSELGQITRGY